MADLFDLGNVPFYWRVKSSPKQFPLDIPERLPFSFDFIEHLQLLIQRRDREVLGCLERVYKEDANVGYLQEGHSLAESYGGEFLRFFNQSTEKLLKKPDTAADIGCGGVYLLQKIREQGLSVKGIDPSPVTVSAGKKAGIDIIPEFYPVAELTERFDILFHYDVLEHVENPVEFLRAHHKNLTQEGAIIFAVPDCTQHIKLGDVSMVLHEHLNYFDKESLALVVRSAGFEPLLLEPAEHGGVLFCCAIPGTDKVAGMINGREKFSEFCLSASSALAKFKEVASHSDNGELGLYVPLRAFPYLGHLPGNLQLRFFDDDPGLHGCFYDGFPVPVENRADFAENPPTLTIICSLAFGDRISSRLPEHIRTVKWSELFA